MATPTRIPEHDEAAKYLTRMFKRAASYRSKFDKEWERNVKWIRGDQRFLEKKFWQANTVTNLLWSETYTLVPAIAGREPDLQLRPRNTNLEFVGDNLGSWISREIRDNKPIKQAEAAVWAMVAMGIAWWKFVFDPMANGGTGGLKMMAVPTQCMYMEPGLQDFDYATYTFEVRRYSKLQALRRFKNHDKVNALFARMDKKRVISDHELGEFAGLGSHAGAAPGPGPTTTTSYMFAAAGDAPHDRYDIPVIECHFLDETEKEFKVEDEARVQRDGPTAKIVEPNKTKRAPRYPNGRVVTFSGDYVLEDRDEPFPGLPYAAATNVYLEHHPYSLSTVEVGRAMQRQMNEATNNLFDGVGRSFGRTIYSGERAQLNEDMVTGEPDEIVHVEESNDLQFVDNPSIPPGAFALPAHIKEAMQMVFGTTEALRGEKVGDVRSGFAIELLQQGAANRSKSLTEGLEDLYKEAARFTTHMIAAQYREGTDYGEEITQALDKLQIKRTGLAPHMFEYFVRAGINLRSSRAADIQFFQWMFEKRMLDEEYFVRHADIPEKAELITRLKPIWDARKEQELLAVEIAAQQAATGAGGGPQ